MEKLLLVGLGGALGAMARYALGLVPIKAPIPVMTLAINFLGAFAIGVIACLLAQGAVSEAGGLFWKVGVCGGFTTFSSFSLETLTLLQSGHPVPAVCYILLSVALCLAGVAGGQAAGRLLRTV